MIYTGLAAKFGGRSKFGGNFMTDPIAGRPQQQRFPLKYWQEPKFHDPMFEVWI